MHAWAIIISEIEVNRNLSPTKKWLLVCAPEHTSETVFINSRGVIRAERAEFQARRNSSRVESAHITNRA